MALQRDQSDQSEPQVIENSSKASHSVPSHSFQPVASVGHSSLPFAYAFPLTFVESSPISQYYENKNRTSNISLTFDLVEKIIDAPDSCSYVYRPSTISVEILYSPALYSKDLLLVLIVMNWQQGNSKQSSVLHWSCSVDFPLHPSVFLLGPLKKCYQLSSALWPWLTLGDKQYSPRSSSCTEQTNTAIKPLTERVPVLSFEKKWESLQFWPRPLVPTCTTLLSTTSGTRPSRSSTSRRQTGISLPMRLTLWVTTVDVLFDNNQHFIGPGQSLCTTLGSVQYWRRCLHHPRRVFLIRC